MNAVVLVFVALLGLASSKLAIGPIDQRCLHCICVAESNCTNIPCVPGRGCGYFHLTEAEWKECGSIGNSWHACASDLLCSSSCVQLYVALYAHRCIQGRTCEHYARTVFGGPENCQHNSTLHYWHAVHHCLQHTP